MDWVDIIAKFILPYLLIIILLLLFPILFINELNQEMERGWTLMFWRIFTKSSLKSEKKKFLYP